MYQTFPLKVLSFLTLIAIPVWSSSPPTQTLVCIWAKNHMCYGWGCVTSSKFNSIPTFSNPPANLLKQSSHPHRLKGLMGKKSCLRGNYLLFHLLPFFFVCVNFFNHPDILKKDVWICLISLRVEVVCRQQGSQNMGRGRAVQVGAAESTPGDLCPSWGWAWLLLCTYSSLATYTLHSNPFPSCCTFLPYVLPV